MCRQPCRDPARYRRRFNRITAPAATLEHTKNDGDRQFGLIGTVLRERLRVRVTRNGTSVPGILVTWSADEPGSTLNPTQSISDASGSVSTNYTVGYRNGFQHIFASIPHDTLTFWIVGVSDPLLGINITRGDGLTLTSDVVLGVQLVDIYGGPVGNEPIAWTLDGGNAILSDSMSTTGANGEAITHLTLTTDPGSASVSANSRVGGVGFSVTLH